MILKKVSRFIKGLLTFFSVCPSFCLFICQSEGKLVYLSIFLSLALLIFNDLHPMDSLLLLLYLIK